MKRILRAVLVTGALLSSVLVASTGSTAQAGEGPPPTFNELYESIPMTVNGDYTPIFGLGCAGEGEEDILPFIFWYAPGAAADHLWHITSIDPFEYTSTPVPVNGTYEPLIGDFDGDLCDDILWYGPGGAPDSIWWGETGLDFTPAPVTINGTFDPVVGYFGEDDLIDIFWYAPGTATEHMWEGKEDRTFSSAVGPAVNGQYEIESIGDSILFHKPGPGTDYFWGNLDAATGDHESGHVTLNGSYNPEASWYGFLLYGAGGAPDHLLYDWDGEGNTLAIPGTINGTYADDVRSPDTFLVHVWHAPGSAPDSLWLPSELGTASAAEAADAMASAEAPEFTGRR